MGGVLERRYTSSILQRLSAPQNRQVNSSVLGIASPPSQRLAKREKSFGENVRRSTIIVKAAREPVKCIADSLTTQICVICLEIAVAGCLVPHKSVCMISAIPASHQQLNCAFSCHVSLSFLINFTPQFQQKLSRKPLTLLLQIGQRCADIISPLRAGSLESPV